MICGLLSGREFVQVFDRLFMFELK